MKKLFIAFLSVLLVVCVVNVKNSIEATEKYPTKPIVLIVPLEAGGGLDIVIRPFCEKLGALLGQSVVVVNKPGAGSSIGYRAMHDAKPDGYTLGAAMLTLPANKLQGLLPYDHSDYTHLGATSIPTPLLVASTRSKRTFKTFKEVIEFAKSRPGDISMAAGGKGGGWWNAAKEFEAITGARFNIVLSVGTGASHLAQVSGGHVEVGIVDMAGGKPQVEAGNLIPLATLVPGNRRLSILPNVPCVTEFGYNMRYASLGFIVGPPNMPKEITDILVKAVGIVSKDPEYAKFVEERTGSLSISWSPEETIAHLDKQRDILRDIFDKAGLLKEK